MSKKYEAYLLTEDEEWVVYQGSRRMVQAFKEGAKFSGTELNMREIKNGNRLQGTKEKPKMEYHDKTASRTKSGRGDCS